MKKYLYYIRNINGFESVNGYIDNDIGYHLIWKTTKNGKRYPNWWVATDLMSGLRICKAKKLNGCKEKVIFLKKDIEDQKQTTYYKEKVEEMNDYILGRFTIHGICRNFKRSKS